MSKHTPKPKWQQGVNANSRHWVTPNDGRVKGINAGNAETAALIERSVNGYEPALAHLVAMLESAFPLVSDTIQAAHDFVLTQGYSFHYDQQGHIRYTTAEMRAAAYRALPPFVQCDACRSYDKDATCPQCPGRAAIAKAEGQS
jgi:hypothetical protein